MLEQLETYDWCMQNYLTTIVYLKNKLERDVMNHSIYEELTKILNMLTGGEKVLIKDVAQETLKLIFGKEYNDENFN